MTTDERLIKLETIMQEVRDSQNKVQENITCILGNCNKENLALSDVCNRIGNNERELKDIKDFIDKWSGRIWAIVGAVIVAVVLSAGSAIYNYEKAAQHTQTTTPTSNIVQYK